MTENKLAVPIAIVIAGVLVAGAIFFSGKGEGQSPFAKNTDQQKTTLPTVEPVTEKDNILGNPNADIIIVEYSDLECPFCKNFHNTTKQMMDEYGKDGKVALVFRHFPLDIHPKAFNEAVAAECAAQIGGKEKFWSFIDGVFAVTPSNNGLDPAELPKIAEKIGIEKTAFANCLANQTTKARVQADIDSGTKSGVQGTPFSIVITKKGVQTTINGAQPYSYVKSVIETILAEAK